MTPARPGVQGVLASPALTFSPSQVTAAEAKVIRSQSWSCSLLLLPC